ncbi:t-complex protein 1 subunit delta [Trichonephila clavipes]|nr:t-complex protein 1 subunit delta [Trichonephila clavipes]
MLERNEISSLVDFTTVTELLEDITSSLSGEQYTTASAVLPLYMKIKNNLQHKDEDSSLLKSIKSEILESLNKYESHPMSSNLQLSTLCDPRFQQNFIESPKEVKKLAVAKMRNIYTTQKISNPDNFENIETRTKEQNKKGLAKFFDVFGSNSNLENTRNPSQEAEKELNEYLSMPRVSFEHDPLDWWKVHYKSFPSLKVLSRKYLCIQVSRGCGLVFTIADLVHSLRQAITFLMRHHIGGIKNSASNFYALIRSRGRHMSSEDANMALEFNFTDRACNGSIREPVTNPLGVNLFLFNCYSIENFLSKKKARFIPMNGSI